MPTPSDHEVEPPTPPLEASSSRASFASCPPEEERDAHPPREPRTRSQSQRAESSRHVLTQEPTPEPDTQPGALPHEAQIKTEHIEDAGIIAESPSPVGSPDPVVVSNGEVRSAQEDGIGPKYLVYPPFSGRERVCAILSLFIRPFDLTFGSLIHTQQPPSSDLAPNSAGRNNPIVRSTMFR